MLRTPTLIDYTQEDFATNGQTCDVIFDAVGMHSFRRSKTSLNPGGMYLATDHLRSLALALWTSRIGSKKVVFPIPPRYTKKDVLFLSELIEAGKYRAVIDRCYPLEQVIEATRYVETGTEDRQRRPDRRQRPALSPVGPKGIARRPLPCCASRRSRGGRRGAFRRGGGRDGPMTAAPGRGR